MRKQALKDKLNQNLEKRKNILLVIGPSRPDQCVLGDDSFFFIENKLYAYVKKWK